MARALSSMLLHRFLHTHHFKEIRIFSRDEKKQDDMRNHLKNEKLKFYMGDERDSGERNYCLSYALWKRDGIQGISNSIVSETDKKRGTVNGDRPEYDAVFEHGHQGGYSSESKIGK